MRWWFLTALPACSTPDADPWLAATDYCETAVDLYCPYYLRCGRLAVETEAECRTAFLEVCNARYEPHYAALEDRDSLKLSRPGVESCRRHLESVACELQIFDLDGPCAGMWVGQDSAGVSCGLGIESFVCDESSTCVIGLDLCGTCEAALPVGATCGDGDRCRPPGHCADGTCTPDVAVGSACSGEPPCVSGAWCEAGTCVSPAIVALGDTCDTTHRCPYKSVCSGGECVGLPLLGEDCARTTGCASGWCDDGTCVALKADGESCDSPIECGSGVCDATCGTLPGVCFEG